MSIYVLDSSALIRYIDNEPGAERMEEILKACALGRARVEISVIQWGEVAGNIRKRAGAREEGRILSLLPSEVQVVAVTGDGAIRAAALKVDCGMAYADAFALELAMESSNKVLVTADYGFKAVEELCRIEFLPAK